MVGQWEGGGTQTGNAFDDMPIGSLPAGTGKTIRPAHQCLHIPVRQQAGRLLFSDDPNATRHDYAHRDLPGLLRGTKHA